jgi:hypothetical protein
LKKTSPPDLSDHIFRQAQVFEKETYNSFLESYIILLKKIKCPEQTAKFYTLYLRALRDSKDYFAMQCNVVKKDTCNHICKCVDGVFDETLKCSKACKQQATETLKSLGLISPTGKPHDFTPWGKDLDTYVCSKCNLKGHHIEQCPFPNKEKNVCSRCNVSGVGCQKLWSMKDGKCDPYSMMRVIFHFFMKRMNAQIPTAPALSLGKASEFVIPEVLAEDYIFEVLFPVREAVEDIQQKLAEYALLQQVEAEQAEIEEEQIPLTVVPDLDDKEMFPPLVPRIVQVQSSEASTSVQQLDEQDEDEEDANFIFMMARTQRANVKK